MSAPATPACARSRPRSAAIGRRSQILRGDGNRVADIRPLVRLNVSVVVEENGRMESGGYGAGGAHRTTISI